MAGLGAIGRLFTGKPVFRRPAAAVEIGNDRLKIAAGRFSLFGSPVGQLQCTRLADTADVLTAPAAQALQAAACPRHGVTACLPRSLVTVRVIRVPSTDPDELGRMVSLQVSRQTPYSRDEVVSGYRVLGSDADGYSTVLLAIARRKVIAERLDAFAQAGIAVNRVTVGSDGLDAWFAKARPANLAAKASTVLLDVDTASTELVIFDAGRMAFSKNILVGVSHLAEDAGKWRAELAREAVAAVERFQAERPGFKAEAAVLAGPESVSGFADALKDALKLPVQVADPLRNLSVAGGARALAQPGLQDASIVAVLGCVADPDNTAIDLTPPEIHMERAMARRRGQLNWMGFLALLIACLIGALLFIAYYGRHLELRHLRAGIDAARPRAHDVEEKIARVGLLRQRLDASGAPLSLLAELYRVTPEGVTLSSVALKGRRSIVLRGRGTQMTDVVSYTDILEKSPLFEGVKATHTAAKRVENIDFAEFEIQGQCQAAVTPGDTGQAKPAGAE